MLLLLLACTSPAPVASLAPAPSFTLPAPPTLAPGFVATPFGVRGQSGAVPASFTADGTAHLGHLAVRTTGVGRAGNTTPARFPTPTLTDCAGTPCVQLGSAPGVTEWWTEHDGAYEQGWTIQAAPPGSGELVVEVGLGGAATVSGDTSTIQVPGHESWVVSDLHAWDATGRELATRLDAAGAGLRIAVDDLGAVYPVRVDPVYATPDYTLGGTAFVVSGGGVVNGDGLVDAVMSCEGASGCAVVYMGNSTGFDTTFDWYWDGLDATDNDEIPIAFAGDVNGDGYDEVIASGDVAEHVYVYAGSSTGSSETATWTLSEHAGPGPTSYPGPIASVAAAGDVNADGYDDVVIGVATMASEPGYATVHLGSSAGLVDNGGDVVLHADNAAAGLDLFGWSVGGAGDVDGDGYDDVVVGGNGGFVTVFYGSATGPSDARRTTLESEGHAASVAGAGDVNGDGYDDVVVGRPRGDYPWDDETDASTLGQTLIFLGGPGGIATTPAWTHDGVTSDAYGYSVAGAGDVNADGYDDVITGTEQQPDIYLGSSAGLAAEPVATIYRGGYSVSGAGDVDRDGRDDVIVGGGRVYLAATFLNIVDTAPDTGGDSPDAADSDTNPPPDSDTGQPSGGCASGKGGCSAAALPRTGWWPATLALAALARRRRPTNPR